MSELKEGYPVYEVAQAFTDVERSEDRRSKFNMEADAIHKKTVEAWDRLFTAIAEITRKHENSQALRDSKMSQYLPETRPANDVHGSLSDWYGDKKVSP